MTVGIETLTGAYAGHGAHFRDVPFRHALPHPMYFRSAQMPQNATYPRHSHPWGEFVYSYSGMMEVSLNDGHYLAPPHYAVWLPPDIEHRGLNRHAAVHCSLYVDPSLCERLPQETTALEVSPLLRAMLEHLRAGNGEEPGAPEHLRFLQVIVDLVATAPRVGTYLPWSTDEALEPVLDRLQQNPADNRSLAEHARLGGMAERTLIRRCLRDLGMPFTEWKQRLRVVKAMPMLEANNTVADISATLGYSNASSFIAMFKRMTGVTPDDYRFSTR